ncbi:MAG: GNAT family N-acetyltransferase [Alphaproteobacteria bacterium]|nr:GNAT family N-acetyltransferase [Alphaproteobacteria bacterium]
MTLKIRPPDNRDFPDWLPLWDGNNLGHRDEKVTSETWTRLTDPDFPVYGLVAEKNSALVGLLHYVVHPTTGNIKPVCYMQDVYVTPDHRREGIARKLIQHLVDQANSHKKWTRIYWLAESNNEAAQTLYKTLGSKMDFTLHMLKTD